MTIRIAVLFVVFMMAALSSFHYLGLLSPNVFSGASMSLVFSYIAGFFPMDASASHLHKVWQGSFETLAMSVLGTLLAGGIGLLLALLQYSVSGNTLARHVVRLMSNVLRAVPELVWAALMVLLVGLGPFSGTLAIAIHTAGVLARLFSETLDNISPRYADSLLHLGAGRITAFFYGGLSIAAPQLMSYLLYRWENNIRIAAVLGFVGAGGLGQMLYLHLSLFQNRQAATVILAILLLVLLVDVCSLALRRLLVRNVA